MGPWLARSLYGEPRGSSLPLKPRGNVAAVPGYTFVLISSGEGLAFSCQHCARPLTIRLDDMEGPSTCRGCGTMA